MNIFTKIDISTRAVIKFVFLMPKNDHLVHEAYSTLFNFEKVRGSSGVETPIGMNKTQDMVFDHAESICDSGEPVRRRVGAVGVLDSVVGGPRRPIFQGRGTGSAPPDSNL